MPLVYAGRSGEEPITEAQERLRKVNPQYTRGEAVKVGFARNQAEAELLQGMLLEEGVPSLMRRSGGFDVPDFLAAGPRDILVPASGAELAREILGVPPTPDPPAFGEGTPAWVKALAVALAVALVAVIAAGVFAAVF